MLLFRKLYLARMRALAAAGALVIGIQSPRPLNAQSNNNATYTAARRAPAGLCIQKAVRAATAEYRRWRVRPPAQRHGFHPEVYWQAGSVNLSVT